MSRTYTGGYHDAICGHIVRAHGRRVTAPTSNPPAVRRAARVAAEALEGRTLFANAFALSGSNLLRFDTVTPTNVQTTAIIGVAAGETLVAIDFSPQNGLLLLDAETTPTFDRSAR